MTVCGSGIVAVLVLERCCWCRGLVQVGGRDDSVLRRFAKVATGAETEEAGRTGTESIKRRELSSRVGLWRCRRIWLSGGLNASKLAESLTKVGCVGCLFTKVAVLGMVPTSQLECAGGRRSGTNMASCSQQASKQASKAMTGRGRRLSV
ncbi:hypothetical protein B0T10DRAFT_209229 [Thelonectria olida]|uniref:Secreted protein n=1 Tax=Thelonectria olida TaxID=1576542 RepID=A0A9P8WEV5_9HYPO|nr:hypothetical protein B0T10DRAFT_209229 [Thelonectria olida]